MIRRKKTKQRRKVRVIICTIFLQQEFKWYLNAMTFWFLHCIRVLSMRWLTHTHTHLHTMNIKTLKIHVSLFMLPSIMCIVWGCPWMTLLLLSFFFLFIFFLFLVWIDWNKIKAPHTHENVFREGTCLRLGGSPFSYIITIEYVCGVIMLSKQYFCMRK